MPLTAPLDARLKVLVLAGANVVPAGDLDDASHRMAEETPLEAKSFVHIRGRLVIEYVLDWLLEAGLQHIWVLAPGSCLRQIPARYRVATIEQRAGATLGQNLRQAREVIAPADDEPALVVFGDHPLTTVQALHDFLAYCAPLLEQADLFHGLALRDAYLAYTPFFHRTSVMFRECPGRATGLNLMVASRIEGIPAADHVYSVRKLERFGRFVSLLGRALWLLGPSAPSAMLDAALLYAAKEFEKRSRRPGRRGAFATRAMNWLSRRVPVARVERHAAKLFGTERGVRVVPLAHGGTAIDVDFVEELDLIEQNWEALQQIARRQDEASRAATAQRSGTTKSSW